MLSVWLWAPVPQCMLGFGFGEWKTCARRLYQKYGVCALIKRCFRLSWACNICKLLISKYFFFESDFCTITLHFFSNPISKMSCSSLLQLNMVRRRHIFKCFGFWNRGKNEIGENQNSLWLVAFERWFGRSHLVVVKNSTIHFILKLGIVW